jgi:hypothetical protein
MTALCIAKRRSAVKFRSWVVSLPPVSWKYASWLGRLCTSSVLHRQALLIFRPTSGSNLLGPKDQGAFGILEGLKRLGLKPH